MFEFSREKILPLFLAQKITTAEFARRAGISFKAAARAVNGLSISAPVATRVAEALGIDPIKFLCTPRKKKVGEVHD